MTRQRLLGLAVVLLLVLNGITVWTLFHRPHPGGPPPEERPKMMVIERLGLDRDQVRRYEELIAAHRKAISAKDDEIRAAHRALFEGLQDANGSQRDSIAEVIGRLQASVERIHYDHFAQVRALCRPDQVPEFDALIGELAGFFGKRPPPGPRP